MSNASVWTPSSVYASFLILCSIIGGFVNLYQVINFMKQSKLRFLSTRNPPLIIMYCIIALVTAFTTTPINLYLHFLAPIVHPQPIPFFAKFTSEFFHEFCTIILLVCILSRAWLLYYDYKFSEASSDLIWRNIVNDTEENFWISHRKTLGNLYFVICFALTVDSISLCFMSLVGSFGLKNGNDVMLHYFSLFVVGLPLYLFIIYLIMHRIQLINDIYLIQKEIKYLSFCILARILAFVIDLFLEPYDDALFFMSIEVLTVFISVWIQCWWVLSQLNKLEMEREYEGYMEMQRATSNSVRTRTSSNVSPRTRKERLKMEDILDNEISFSTFIRHCTQELSVEAILFLIETAQFKATLDKYNACGFDVISHRFIDVSTSNIVQFIKQAREERLNQKLIIHPAPKEEVTVERGTPELPALDPDADSNLSPPSPLLTLSPLNTSESVSPEPTPPPLGILRGNTSHDEHSTPDNNTITPDVSPGPIGPLSPGLVTSTSVASAVSPNPYKKAALHTTVSINYHAAVASYRAESEYKRFQETVLDKKWLPIARPLLASKRLGRLFAGSSLGDTHTGTSHTDTSKTKSGNTDTRTRTGTGTTTGTGKTRTVFTKSSRELPSRRGLSKESKESKEKYMDNGFIAPITLAVIEDDSHIPSKESSTKKTPTGSKDDTESTNKNKTIDVNWMFDYGRHLYQKYVDNSADLAINVSHDIRRKLWGVYSKESNAEAFQKIQLLHHEDLSKISRLSTKEEHLFMQTYLYHSFDLAFHSVWLLLQSDTFYRFQKTPQYKTLCEKIDALKLHEAREERDKEYSRSYQETFLEI